VLLAADLEKLANLNLLLSHFHLLSYSLIHSRTPGSIYAN
jgi:hypothetical protein